MIKLWMKITFTVDKGHPDYEYMYDEVPGVTQHTFYDTFTFRHLDAEDKVDKRIALDFAKRDLKLVAGGGYNWKHIHNAKFNYMFL